jgi:hypothetical protein
MEQRPHAAMGIAWPSRNCASSTRRSAVVQSGQNYLAGVVDQTTGVWNLASLGTGYTPEYRSLESDVGWPKFSPGGKYLAVSIEDTVRIWSTTDGKMPREAKLKTGEGWAVSPGAHYLLGPRDADEEGTRSVFRLSTPSPTRKSRELLLTGCEPPPLATTGGHLRSDRILRELWQIIGHGQRHRAHRHRTRGRCHSLQRGARSA